ncbi:MAG: hypothetical protein QM760_05900 [Nibricoccus sp.]
MNPATTIAPFLVYAALAGLCGALAMTAVMKLVARSGWARNDMIVAVGSMFTKSRDTGFRVGLILHALSAIVFGQIYTVLIIGLELAEWPSAFCTRAWDLVFSTGDTWRCRCDGSWRISIRSRNSGGRECPWR